MSKTTPVRWWRDDANRYRSRPPYVAPPVDQGAARWALELLRAVERTAPRPDFEPWHYIGAPIAIEPVAIRPPGVATRTANVTVHMSSLLTADAFDAWHHTPPPRPSLLPDRPLTPEERAAHYEDPRPGVWAGEQGADLRALTQFETDQLIRFELYLTASRDERAEIVSVCGGQPGMLVVDDTAETHQADATGSVVGHRRRLASQRGGIDSDPLVRLLAYRAWGDRDRQWFELRGVRKGDEVGLDNWYASGDDARVQRRWTPESKYGVALEDAMPSQPVSVRIAESNRHAVGSIVVRHVSDRLRNRPNGDMFPLGQRRPIWFELRGVRRPR